MAVHKLVLDTVYEEATYTLIAIHCSVEDYRLVYLLNKCLGICLKRQDSDLNFRKANYSNFEWNDTKQFIKWNLVSNICKLESYKNEKGDTLFSEQKRVIKTLNLVPEYKTVNYMLKIDGEIEFNNSKEIVLAIQKIPQIITAYSIAPDQLKSKNNLIF